MQNENFDLILAHLDFIFAKFLRASLRIICDGAKSAKCFKFKAINVKTQTDCGLHKDRHRAVARCLPTTGLSHGLL